MDFIQVGYGRQDFLTWIFIGLAILAVPAAFTKSYRLTGIFTLIGASIELGFKVPDPLGCALIFWFVFSGNVADRYRRKEFEGWRRYATVIACMAFYTVTALWTGSGGSVSIAGDTLAGKDREVGAQDIDRAHLEILQLTGDNGTTVEWRFQPTYAAEEPYVACLPGNAVYQAGFFNYLTSTQVAESVAKWAHVKPLHCSYEVYVEMGRHDLAKP